MKKNIVIAFLGGPKSGKTTNIGKVSRKLEQQNFSVRFIQDQVRDAPIKGDEIEKIKWAIYETGRLIIEAKEQDWDFILIERGGWAQYASLSTHLRNQESKGGKRRIENIKQALASALALTKEENYFVLIEVSPEVAMERDKELGGKDQPDGNIINLPFLYLLQESYQIVKEELPKHRRRIINGEDDFEKIQEKLLSFLISLTRNGDGNNQKLDNPEKI